MLPDPAGSAKQGRKIRKIEKIVNPEKTETPYAPAIPPKPPFLESLLAGNDFRRYNPSCIRPLLGPTSICLHGELRAIGPEEGYQIGFGFD